MYIGDYAVSHIDGKLEHESELLKRSYFQKLYGDKKDSLVSPEVARDLTKSKLEGDLN